MDENTEKPEVEVVEKQVEKPKAKRELTEIEKGFLFFRDESQYYKKKYTDLVKANNAFSRKLADIYNTPFNPATHVEATQFHMLKEMWVCAEALCHQATVLNSMLGDSNG